MDKLHITQDDSGYWMLSLERADGTLSLVAHQFEAPDHLIENANELIREGKVTATIVIDPPRSQPESVGARGIRRLQETCSSKGGCVMSLVYWISDGVGEGVTMGGEDENTPVPTRLIRWIRTKGSPSLIINGGDVYPAGKSREFAEFFKQMDNDVTLMCETPGNHDWKDDPELPQTGRIPHGYETFWQGRPESKQPIDAAKKGGARYEHFIDIDGWRLIFLDTGDYQENPWPAGDQNRVAWLKNSLKPGRPNILLAHHSRLSRGPHGNNGKLDAVWKTLFDGSVTPRVAFTLAGHDHSVSVYGPRSKDDPEGPPVSFDKGIYVFVNGAGGAGHYSGDGPLASGTRPDIFFDDENFCVTRINLVDERSADVDVLNFGTGASTEPLPIPESLVKIRL